MPKRTSRAVAVIGAVAIVVIGFVVWYRFHFAMQPATTFSVNDPSSERRILIATQGSEFKDAVVTGVVDRLRERPIFIQVIDVVALADANEADWDAIVVLHTIEYGRAPAASQAFVDRAEDLAKVVALSTSGGGDATIDGVDAISSASRMTDAPAKIAELVARIDMLLTR
jgi:hypothetical protein